LAIINFVCAELRADFLEETLAEFAEQNKTEVVIEEQPWPNLWNRLKEIALHEHDVNLAEIGSTWLGSIVGMQAARPFRPEEVARLGGSESFVPASCDSAMMSGAGDKRIWAIPWFVDTRAIVYWRDMLEEAGVDEETAFQTPEDMERTLASLQAAGFDTPWVCPTDNSVLTVHSMASWIWQKGGNILSEDGKSAAFTSPEAMEGIRQYFSLHKYLPQDLHPMGEGDSFDWFGNRKAAVTITGPWIRSTFRGLGVGEDMLANLGTAAPPGPAFVGGTHLVIWRHALARHERITLKLIECLTSARVQSSEMITELPARVDVLNAPPYSDDPYWRIFSQALQGGRSFPCVPLWGTVEDRMRNTLAAIWISLNENPEQDIDGVLELHLGRLAKQLNRILKG
jgi:multiple sugar transport system substrate-binding protein